MRLVRPANKPQWQELRVLSSKLARLPVGSHGATSIFDLEETDLLTDGKTWSTWKTCGPRMIGGMILNTSKQ
jgi:hypothetical protein